MPELPIYAQVLYWGLVAFSIILHEIAHGYAALQCGDETAKDAGRITLNPAAHIDPFGTVIFPLVQILTTGRVLIGWAKPVPVNPLSYGRPRRDDIIVSTAGVAVNLGIAIGLAIFAGIPWVPWWLYLTLIWAALTNVGLCVFNLVPIPPLDGSHVLKHFLPPDVRVQYEQIGFYGTFILLALIASGALTPILGPPIEFIFGRLVDLSYFVSRLFP
jgi:Zn-dependent protease